MKKPIQWLHEIIDSVLALEVWCLEETLDLTSVFGIGITEWYYKDPKKAEEWMNLGYDMVKKFNGIFSQELKINPSIRVTTVKPSGTLSSMVGVPR